MNVGEEADLVVNIGYINRYVNLPASIGLSEDQKLQYEDIKFVLDWFSRKQAAVLRARTEAKLLQDN